LAEELCGGLQSLSGGCDSLTPLTHLKLEVQQQRGTIMPIRFYNTLAKKKEAFVPLKARQKLVTMYNCGLTVYDFGHIGNFRAYVFADLIRRYLEYRGYQVRQVMNFTDVGHMTLDAVPTGAGEDKLERAAREKGKTPQEIAQYYIKAFLEDSKALNLKEPAFRPKATDHIKEMIEIIKKLIDKGYAYVTPSGNVYYSVHKFKNYGKLSGNPLNQLMAGARVEPEPEKKHPYDFALWKVDPRHLMQWESPWGKGFPGWHIECSAMSTKYLGNTIDIHTGGEDNIFPHHECEIAQSEGATGKKFVRYWMHTRHLLVNGQKMSKSLGNFFTLRDLLQKGYDPKAVRYLLMSAHYRDQLNFTLKELEAAQSTVSNLIDFVDRLQEIRTVAKTSKQLSAKVAEARRKFESALDDDLNVPLALAAIFDLVKETNKAIAAGKASEKNLKEVYKAMMDFDKVLGVLEHEKLKLTKQQEQLIKRREAARKRKDFKTSDKIRAQLKEQGIILEDLAEGVRWRRA